jgi:hypothetical protein
MICTGKARIAAMVRCDHYHIVSAEFLHKGPKLHIKIIDCLSICRNVSSVTVYYIGIYQIDIAKSFEITFGDIDRPFHIGIVSLVRIAYHYTLAGEDVLDLADTDIDET